MSSLSIDGSLLGYSTSQVSSTQSVSTLATYALSNTLLDAVTSSSTSATDPATVDISKPGELFAKLKQLKEQDPTKYKEVLTDIASKLSTAAQSATGDDQTFLTKLADKFTKAANGDDSALEPPQPPSNSSSNSLTSTALAAYSQASNTDQGALAGLTSGSSSSSTSGHHHHPTLSDSTKNTLSGILDEVNSALSASSAITASV